MKVFICSCVNCRHHRRNKGTKAVIKTGQGGIKKKINQLLGSGNYDKIDEFKAIYAGYPT